MRLIRLKLEHFAGVASGHVEFGPGLNVLYGPNELGKSTMAEAIRAALLVQHSSKIHVPWVRWNTDESPTVELVFQTEPQRFWRVKKSFGSGAKGKATLDESKDGTNFSNLAKARRVDGEIRKLLKWGIPEPGGAGGVKGLPQTFLTTVLLPHQDNVADVFSRDLGDDYDESGKQMLRDALEAIATDPLFSGVLSQAQAKVDEAFTAGGHRKKGKLSPWKRISDEIKQADERVRQSKEDEQKSESVRLHISELHDQLLDATEQLEKAEVALRQREVQFKRAKALADELAKAEADLARVKDIHDEYAKLTAKEDELGRKVDELTLQFGEAVKAVDEAETEIRVAQEAVDAATSEQTAAQRHIKQQACENEILQLDVKEKQAQEVLRKAEMVREVRVAIELLESATSDDSAQLMKAKESIETITRQVQVLVGLETWQLKQEAMLHLQSAEKVSNDIAQWRKENAEMQTEFNELQEHLENSKVPSEEQLADMKQLREDQRVAGARLEVGLSVTLSPQRDLNSTAISDDDPPKDFQLESDSRTIEADRLAKLTIEGVVDITVRGGKSDAREAADALAVRWQEEIEPALEAAGVATLDELLAARTATDKAIVRARDLRQSIQRNNDQIEAKEGDAANLVSIQENVERLAEQLADFDADAHAEQITALESSPMQDRTSVIRKLRDEEKAELEKLNVAIAGDEARLKGKQTDRDAKLVEVTKLEDELGEPWQQALDNAQAALVDYQQKRTSQETQLAALKQKGESELADAQRRLDAAKKCHDEALDTRKKQAKQREELSAELNKCGGEKIARQGAFEAADLPQTEANVDQVKARQAELLSGGAAAETTESLDSERKLVAQMRTDVHNLQTQIHNEEGALRHVGGDIARERHASFSEALQQKQNQESEMALDYDAWQLLLGTLREVENDEAAHLGQAIVEPVTERIIQLTGSRYGEIKLGPALETHGIVAQGEMRALDRLSVGTREQLSTILRLTLAEHLGSVLVLDDQLAQSDPQRIEWFRDMFRESANKTQIIVLTCRPADYLLPSELTSGSKYTESPHGMIRAANLELLISSSVAAD